MREKKLLALLLTITLPIWVIPYTLYGFIFGPTYTAILEELEKH